jgi:hypothetical protein
MFPMHAQVEQILGLRGDLMEASEKLRRSETDRQQLEADIAGLKQQVMNDWCTGAGQLMLWCYDIVSTYWQDIAGP